MRKLTQNEFLQVSNIQHNYKYDYSKSIYKNRRSDIIIGCKKHGDFIQGAGAHMYGNGCSICANNIKCKNEEFIEKAIKIHGDKYTYNKVDYIDAHEKIIITCLKHGDYSQKPNSHLNGSGCRKCFNNKIGDFTRKKKEDFIKEAIEKHGDRYTYSKLNYIDNKEQVEIICKKHGSFFQSPSNHLGGSGCSKCSNNQTSKPENELQEFVKSFYSIEINNRKILKGKELDIYIPELKKAIEFNGLYWHYSKKYFVAGKHALKSNICREKGIILLHLREDLWKKDKEKMKQIILKFLENGISI